MKVIRHDDEFVEAHMLKTLLKILPLLTYNQTDGVELRYRVYDLAEQHQTFEGLDGHEVPVRARVVVMPESQCFSLLHLLSQ